MKSLENHSREDRTNRSIWGWLQRDKLSSAWLQVLPGPDTSMSSAEFSEAAASALCILLPACLEKLGQVIRCRQVLDLLDETQQAITIESDTMPLSNVPTCFQSFTKESIWWRGVGKSNQLFQICGSLFPRRETLSSKISTHAKDSFHLAFFPPRRVILCCSTLLVFATVGHKPVWPLPGRWLKILMLGKKYILTMLQFEYFSLLLLIANTFLSFRNPNNLKCDMEQTLQFLGCLHTCQPHWSGQKQPWIWYNREGAS